MKNGLLSALLLAMTLLTGAAFAESPVARTAFTTGIAEREPTDKLTSVPRDMARLYYFTELRGLEGQTITHRWETGGKVTFEMPFQVGAARWRVWSNKELMPGTTGDISVVVVDASGKELSRESISVAGE